MDALLVGAAVAPLAGLYAASCFGEVRGLHDWLVPGAVWRTARPHVALTFDDGPHPERTPRLLDALAKAGARATFFLVGAEAERHPALVARIAKEGHVIGNHSWSHPWFLVSGRARIAEELDRTQALLTALTGAAPTLARPPYGQRDFRFNRLARARGLTPVLWSHNLRDYWGSSAAVLLQRLRRRRAGEVVLLHDGDPKARHTVAAVEAWLETAPAVGLI